MIQLSDMFFVMYAVDLPTLGLIAEETLRILAERTRDSSQGVAAPSGRENLRPSCD